MENIILIASVLTSLGVIVATSTAPTNVSGTLNSKEANTVDVNGVIFA